MVCKRGSLSSSSSKGQVTIFIIIGIVLLFAFAGTFYLVKTTTKEQLEADGEAVIISVPQDFRPIQAYTENCLYQIGKQGIVTLGQQGGYIYPDLLGEYSIANPTSGVGINLEPTKVPYWSYNVAPNEGKKVTYASLRPKMTFEEDQELSIEAQLGRYLNERIEACVDDYSAFVSQGFSVGSLKGVAKQVSVKVGKEFVTFILSMEVKVAKGSADALLEKFLVRIPINLPHFYKVAQEIADSQRELGFLERQGMELVSVYSRRDINSLAPISGITHEPVATLSWSELILEQKFKGLLSSYISMLQFLGSSNFFYQPPQDGKILLRKVIDNSVLPLLGADDLEVRFDYHDWPIYFSTNSEDGLIKPDHYQVSFELFNFATQRYETHYDISYPVMVSLNDPVAFAGEGYDFIFALESNIRNNGPPSKLLQEEKVFNPPLTSIACKKEHRNSQTVRSVVVDSFTKEPLDLVQIAFHIPEQETCDIGVTNSQGKVEEKYPKVYGGELSLIKEEYLTNYYPLDTFKLKDELTIVGNAVSGVADKVIQMHKFKPIKLGVEVKDFKKCVKPLICEYTIGVFGVAIPFRDITCELGEQQCFFNAGNDILAGDPAISLESNGSIAKNHSYYFVNRGRELADNEEAIIVLERVDDIQQGVNGQEYTVSTNVIGPETKEVDLVPGVYKVNIVVTKNQELRIADEERCVSFSVLVIDAEQCFEIGGSTSEKSLIGFLDWNTPETYITITPEDLYNSEEMVLSVMAQDLYNVPERGQTIMKECASLTCAPVIGCLFEACLPKDIPMNTRVAEDLQVPGLIKDLANLPEYRRVLEPQYRNG